MKRNWNQPDLQDGRITSSKMNQFVDCIEQPAWLLDKQCKLLYANEAGQALACDDLPFLGERLIAVDDMMLEDRYVYAKGSYTRTVRRVLLEEEVYYLEIWNQAEEAQPPFDITRELELIIDSVQEGIYVTDEHGFTIRINKSYSENTGISRSEVLGKHVSELISTGYFDDSVTLKVMKHKKPVSLLQKIKEKNQMWLVMGKPVLDEEGNIRRIVNTLHNMTELNEMREVLKEQSLLIREQTRELEILRSQLTETGEVIANSYKMQQVVSRIRRLAKVDSSVIILGETGCGKNMFARAIHRLSDRSAMNFIEVNCGAIPEHLFESELFGYENGAFTGATRGGKTGLLEAAHMGTLFLDEVAEMPMNLQVKLLSVLQSKKIRRIGGVKEIDVDVRIVAATNKDPQQLIAEKKLREDLYYRLSVVPVMIPPLRERKDDVYALAEHFIKRYNSKHNLNVKFSKAVFLTLESYHWPGNVRELEHLIEQLIVLADNQFVDVDDLPRELQLYNKVHEGDLGKDLKTIVEDVERKLITEEWEKYQDIYVVAERLGMHRTTLIRKIKKLGLQFTKLKQI
ncbi:sigma-54 interaction domain-containing protein [Brevibacillus sp. NRS-1366]|uniref:sigma-54 interaction domain-containing protein n=1 Tax=Brevibacillus sp. NRS-1366 TaxID=3233899 RepID=UPI003D230540